jgi:hypothetical protein
MRLIDLPPLTDVTVAAFSALRARMSSAQVDTIRLSRLASGYAFDSPLSAHHSGRFRPKADYIFWSDQMASIMFRAVFDPILSGEDWNAWL